MKDKLVIDASVALAWCFPDERSAEAVLVLEEFRVRDGIVPSLWPLEVTNAILVGERRRRLAAADVTRFMGLLSQLSLLVDTITVERSIGHILPLARANDLSAYDAAYLELAMREGVALATFDRKLRRVAKASGVAVFPDQ